MNGIGGLSGGSFDPLSMLKGIGGSVMNGIGGLFGPSTPTPPEATSPEPPSADNDPPSSGFLPLSALSLLRKGLSFF
jgi:hypothetical protein